MRGTVREKGKGVWEVRAYLGRDPVTLDAAATRIRAAATDEARIAVVAMMTVVVRSPFITRASIGATHRYGRRNQPARATFERALLHTTTEGSS